MNYLAELRSSNYDLYLQLIESIKNTRMLIHKEEVEKIIEYCLDNYRDITQAIHEAIDYTEFLYHCKTICGASPQILPPETNLIDELDGYDFQHIEAYSNVFHNQRDLYPLNELRSKKSKRFILTKLINEFCLCSKIMKNEMLISHVNSGMKPIELVLPINYQIDSRSKQAQMKVFVNTKNRKLNLVLVIVISEEEKKQIRNPEVKTNTGKMIYYTNNVERNLNCLLAKAHAGLFVFDKKTDLNKKIKSLKLNEVRYLEYFRTAKRSITLLNSINKFKV